MKTAILLKLWQSCETKVTPNFPKTRSRKGDNGYTLIELIVVVILLGVLASIAAPGWLGFINRQRVRTVTDRVFQSLRLAQSEAKRTKRDVKITFDTSVAPKVTFDPPLPTGGSEQKLDGGGEIKPGTITLLTNVTTAGGADLPLNSIIFDYQGNVKQFPPIGRFVVSVSASPNGAKQCAIVETIIGGMRTAEGNDPVTGCL